jgi:adenine-specific DNA-methyltransferase
MQSDFIAFRTIIDGIHTADGTQEVRQLFGAEVFAFPKPSELIEKIAEQVLESGDLMADFFAGSGPSFEAVARLNARTGISAKSLLVQLPEPVEEGSEAFRAGYKTISDVSRERIRRAIKRINAEADLANPVNGTLGFKSFLLAPSSFKQWRGDGIEGAEELAAQMQMFVNSEKDGAETKWKLYELLLKFGQELTTPFEKLEIKGGPVFAIHERAMLFVLESFTEAMIQSLLEMKPREIIVLDSVFHDSDELKTNLDLQCRDAGVKFICL